MNREYTYIDSTISDINKSSDAHFKWLVKVLHYAAKKHEDNLDITGCNAHESCDFGIWLKQKLNEERDDKGFLIEIDEKHIEIHEKCRDLMRSLYCEQISPLLFEEFSVSLLSFNQTLTSYKTHLLQRRTSYDALTGLPLRRVLNESFDSTLDKFFASGLYLLLLDIDHFKKINDKYGHLVGDEVLKDFAIQLDNATRKSEPVYRYGGEEFIILLHAASDRDAFIMAERIRKQIAATKIVAGEYCLNITFTAGLTKLYKAETLHEAIGRADNALYHGKNSGRNRCINVNQKGEMHEIVI